MELLGLSLSVVNNPLNALALSIMWLALYMAIPGVGIGLLSRDKNIVPFKVAAIAAFLFLGTKFLSQAKD